MALDREIDDRLLRDNPDNLILKVLHLESYYNYRTVGNTYELMTSVLSNNDFCKKIEIKNQGKKPVAYIVADEVKCTKSSVHYANIHNKKYRVYAALAQIKNDYKDEIVDIDFINSFQIGLDVEQSENDISLRVKPHYCRDEMDKTKKKLPCSECDSICSYTMDDLLDPQHGIGLDDLKLELLLHHHPKTRKMENGKNRNTFETARELADHYIYSHNNIEPDLL